MAALFQGVMSDVVRSLFSGDGSPTSNSRVGGNPEPQPPPPPQSARQPGAHTYAINDQVEALWRGQASKWYPGTILHRGANGTYNIRFEDGRTEHNVLSQNIRAR